MSLQEFIDAGGGDAEGQEFVITNPVLIPTKTTLKNAKIDATALSGGAALLLSDGTQATGILLEDIILSGGGIKANYVGDSHLHRIRVSDALVGIEIIRGYEFNVEKVKILNCSAVGVRIGGQGADQYLRDIRIVGQTSVGVEICKTSAAWMDNVSTSFCGVGFKAGHEDIAEFVFSQRCCADEGTGHGWHLMQNVRCWRSVMDWSSSNAGCGYYLQNTADIMLTGTRVYNNQCHGIHISGSDISLDGVTCSGNGAAMAGSMHGITIGPIIGCRITNCRSGQVAHFAALQGYGLAMVNPTASNVMITGCDFRHNQIGAKLLVGSPVTANNIP